jgi:LysR family transcriptional activator of nhaA
VIPLNYHHLFYFWTVVREGGVTAASRKLRLAQPTVSGQLRALQDDLGVALFHRRGGKLVLTETGQNVFRYCEEIFTLGQELQASLRGRAPARYPRLVVGLADVIPKLIAERLLEPALRLPEEIQLVCQEGRAERLLADLSAQALDVVLTDAPAGPESAIKAYSHLLGESALSIFAPAKLAARLRKGFPRSLNGAPILLPTRDTGSRRALDRFFEEERILPRVRGEFQDTALLTAFGREGLGAFPAPTVIEDEVRRQYKVEVVGRLEEVRERYFAITVDRRLRHPAVKAISETARADLFGGG